jgi:hypothetical protein
MIISFGKSMFLNETLLVKRYFGGQHPHYQATNCLKEEKKTKNFN